jgi:hypothetical protein
MRPGYGLLTPPEHEPYGCPEREDFRMWQKAGTLDKNSQKVVKAAREHAINLTRRRAKEGQGRNAKICTVAYTVSHFLNLSHITTATCKQTQRTQNPSSFTRRVGSTPTSATSFQ